MNKLNYNNHLLTHANPFLCGICQVSFTSIKDLKSHAKTHLRTYSSSSSSSSSSTSFSPSSSSLSYSSSDSSVPKKKRKRDTTPSPPRTKTRKRRKKTPSERALKLKRLRPPASSVIRTELPLPEVFLPEQMTNEEVLKNFELDEAGAGRDELLEHIDAVRTHVSEPNDKRTSFVKKYCSRYNVMYRAKGGKNSNPKEILSEIFKRQKRCFKINYSYNLMLKDHTTPDRFRFFHASRETGRVLNHPQRISHQKDLDKFISQVENHDPWEFATNNRDDTNWALRAILSTTYYVTPLLEFPIGKPPEELPPFLLAKDGLNTLIKNWQTGVRYDDNLCFFRCLALRLQPAKGLKSSRVNEEVAQEYRSQIDGDVLLANLPVFEEHFKINVNAYAVDTETKTIFPEVRSGSEYDMTMNVLYFENHFMYIKDIELLQLCFSCSKCNAIFQERYNFNKHEKICTGEITKVRYKGGVYIQGTTSVERLANVGVHLPRGYIYPFRIAFDYECYFNETDRQTAKTTFTAEHKVLAVSVCSNVPGFEKSVCLVTDGDTQKLVNKFGDHMEKIRDKAIKELKSSKAIKQAYVDVRNTDNDVGYKMLDQFVCAIPVVGFNSGRYDLNLCKPEMLERFVAPDLRYIEEQKALRRAKARQLLKENAEKKGETFEDPGDEEGIEMDPNAELGPEIEPPLVVKKGHTFLTIATRRFIFLDIVNFIAPGYNYANYLKAYEAKAEKGVFPYEYFNDLKKLDETQLPSHADFFSKLKNKNITDKEYADLCETWRVEGMTTLRDLLVWYNNLDVVPFLDALKHQCDVFSTEFDMDMLKDGWTIPSLTLKYLFRNARANPEYPWLFFSLAEQKQAGFHTLLRDQMVGGPSIIFTRHHEKGKTRLRHDKGKPVEACAGYDANALYLWAMMENHPTEFAITRYKREGFDKRIVRKYGQMAREWLEWLRHESKNTLYIQHQFNAKEKSFAGYRVDGWDGDRTIFEFNGCAFHGHLVDDRNYRQKPCRISVKNPIHPYKKENPITKKPYTREELYRETCRRAVALTTFRKRNNLHLITMWECEWEDEKKANPKIEEWLDTCGIRFKSVFASEDKSRSPINEEVIKTKITAESNGYFGLVRCDIHTPDALKEQFAEFPPIFKKVTISKNDIGDHMKTYCEETGNLKQPRQSLISSYFGKDVVLTSPLLKWYMSKGLVVSNITELYEYKPVKCFENFGNKVTANRRAGDTGEGSKIKADTYKLLGNSSYGKTLENVSKHTNNEFMVGDPTDKNEKRQLALLEKVEQAKRSKHFKDIAELSDTLFEIKASKQSIVWNLPHQIGFFVYQYAKLKMLQFYHDCLCVYFDQTDFELIEMDTDSLYMGLSAPSLETLVKPELRRQFFENRHLWFPSETCDKCKPAYLQAKTGDQPQSWKPCPGCLAKQKADKRTPGLMKLEWSGDGCIALCSKTYICFGSSDGTGDKLATKGVNKNLNSYAKTHFLNVLDTGVPAEAENRGFRTNNNFIETYKQNKIGLSYVYVKRKVLEGGIRTAPLDL